ncbi:TPA: hypothetical protein ACQUHP_005594 [Bacillus cereus]|uniref:hypothetical protein n=1 Tax=Bacillus wiedmannii TaxID=1890302 RepID=UPI0018CD0C00|nr:hypothetical protein [Bacillus wiedmannii]MBG9829645.1 methanol dehydrogenase [Bacillus wiedmannii]UOB98770.1 hypothetical protein BTI679_61710 [Bacillus wiedmannii]
MEFIVIILLFVVIGTILTAVPLNKKKVNLTKQNNTHNSSPLFSYAGSNNDSVYDGSSHDCGGSFGGDSEGSCGGD